MLVTVTVTDAAGHGTSQQVEVVEQSPLLLGMTSGPGSPHNAMMTAFPGVLLTADFGPEGDDPDTLPELPGSWSTGKAANWSTNPRARIHQSWKDDVSLLGPFLDIAPANAVPRWLTWRHEPHGDIAPADYRAAVAPIPGILASHPNGGLIEYWGPCVTRWWLVNDLGDLNDWWIDGMTAVWIDSYNDAMDRYRTPAEQYTRVRDFARSKGVPWGVREWGKKRITGDTTGDGRAAAMRADVEWWAEQGDCLGGAWWNFGPDIGTSRLIGIDPSPTRELQEFGALLTKYGG